MRGGGLLTVHAVTPFTSPLVAPHWTQLTYSAPSTWYPPAPTQPPPQDDGGCVKLVTQTDVIKTLLELGDEIRSSDASTPNGSHDELVARMLSTPLRRIRRMVTSSQPLLKVSYQ